MPPRRAVDYPDAGPQIKPIDVDLPDIRPHGFDEWNERYDMFDTDDERAHFALTGHYGGGADGRPHRRAGLDIDRYKVTGNDDLSLRASCDIDSVLGVTRGHFPIAPTANFMYYMLPDSKQTFTTNVHLPPIEIPIPNQAEPKLVHLHEIPNCRFGTLSDRLVVRLVLPGLYDAEKRKTQACPNYIGRDRMQLIYDVAAHPAAIAVFPLEIHRLWPPRYRHEELRAAPHRNQPGEPRTIAYQQSARHIPGEFFNEWLTEFRRIIDEDDRLPWARGSILFVEGKGLKQIEGSRHDLPGRPLAAEDGTILDEEDSRTVAIHSVLQQLAPFQFVAGEWFLDIATNIDVHVKTGRNGWTPWCLFVDSDLHPEILNHFTGLSIARCADIARGPNQGYEKDQVAHISRFAGFRAVFDEDDGAAEGLVYLQVYTSEKSLTYHLDGHKRAKRTSPHAVLSDWKVESSQYFQPLIDAFFDASGTHPVAVRIESRVPYTSYPFVHLQFDQEACRSWFFGLPNAHFWGFKTRRLGGIWEILEKLCSSPELRSKFTLRELPEVGTLLVVLIFMATALVQRPQDGGNFDEARDSASVHIQRGRLVVPDVPLGYFTLHSLHLSQAHPQTLPRISSHRTISRDTIIYLCGTGPENRTELSFLSLMRGSRKRPRNPADEGDAWGVVQPQVPRAAKPYASNKQQRVIASLSTPPPDVFAALIPDLPRGVRYPSEGLDNELRDMGDALSQRITTIVFTYALQVFLKAPKRKEQGVSWLAEEAFQDSEGEANFNTLKDPFGPDLLFTSYINHGRDSSKWNSTLAAWFPTLDEKANMEKGTKLQGFPQLTVWKDWEILLADLTPEEERNVVRIVRRYVSERWTWLPYYTKLKLWVTGRTASDKTTQQVGYEKGGPWIVYNPRFRR
ncbi:hypothetical protein FRC12_021263 [Ceratobasidium sp. 428]|nr:hypothetical protein FRC12_021263 [Ceratobasidium sp. 428]